MQRASYNYDSCARCSLLLAPCSLLVARCLAPCSLLLACCLPVACLLSVPYEYIVPGQYDWLTSTTQTILFWNLCTLFVLYSEAIISCHIYRISWTISSNFASWCWKKDSINGINLIPWNSIVILPQTGKKIISRIDRVKHRIQCCPHPRRKSKQNLCKSSHFCPTNSRNTAAAQRGSSFLLWPKMAHRIFKSRVRSACHWMEQMSKYGGC